MRRRRRYHRSSPSLLEGLRSGEVPTLGNSRYFLFEPPHHVAPPRLDEFAFQLVTAGFIPVLTHPERLSWIDTHFDIIQRLSASGILMQLTAGSVLGKFGRRPRYWAERILDEGMADLLASDAHNVDRGVFATGTAAGQVFASDQPRDTRGDRTEEERATPPSYVDHECAEGGA